MKTNFNSDNTFDEVTPMTKTIYSVGSKTRTRKFIEEQQPVTTENSKNGISFSSYRSGMVVNQLALEMTLVVKNRKNKSLVTSKEVMEEKQKFMLRFKEANMLRTVE